MLLGGQVWEMAIHTPLKHVYLGTWLKGMKGHIMANCIYFLLSQKKKEKKKENVYISLNLSTNTLSQV